jgi:hypothetical protein
VAKKLNGSAREHNCARGPAGASPLPALRMTLLAMLEAEIDRRRMFADRLVTGNP